MALSLAQIRLKLAMDYLGEEVNIKNYGNICEIYALGVRRKIPVFDFKLGFDDIIKIQTEWDSSFTNFDGFSLDDSTLRRLDDLKNELTLSVPCGVENL